MCQPFDQLHGVSAKQYELLPIFNLDNNAASYRTQLQY
jgi:hypothetical protein